MKMSTEHNECIKNIYLPNDGMYLEEGIAWFVGSQDNIIYCMDISTMQVTPIASLPNNSPNMFRLNPKCIKYDNIIICLPDRGKKIYIYNIENKTFEEVSVKNPSDVRISIFDTWIDEKILWCISYGMNQILELNLETLNIDGYYKIFDTNDDMVGYSSSKVGNIIHCTSRTSSIVAAFDTISKEIRYYKLSINDNGLNTIVFDGKDFWLSGYLGQLYCWNKEKNIVNTLNNLPHSFIENCGPDKRPLFYKSLIINENILFIPWTFPEDNYNPIINVNKKNMNISTLQVESDSKKGNLITIEYVRENRYLVINHLMSSGLEELDLKGESSIIKSDMHISEEKMIDYLKYNMKNLNTINETEVCTAKVFYGYVLNC